MIEYTVAKTKSDFLQILELQRINLPANIDQEEMDKEGFVTLKHTLVLLEELNHPYPHIIAKSDNVVIGYTLITTRDKVPQMPLLQKTIDELSNLTYQGSAILDTKFFIMAQVCIDKSRRGQGIFTGLYNELRAQMTPHFDLIITEIATHNHRSIRAHEKIGFETLKVHKEGEALWSIVGWKI